MVAHSIIIPHRDRFRTLEVCLWSIAQSAEHCGLVGGEDYEVVVVDNGSQIIPGHEWLRAPEVRWIDDWRAMREFNKPRLQNIGIEHAAGNVLTFLDADAVVAPKFLSLQEHLFDEPGCTKLCYRVRLLPHEETPRWRLADNREAVYASWFANYEHYTRAFEAYGAADTSPLAGDEGNGVLFGNSHFSIHRDVLGDLRADESFSGHGFEDIALNWAIAEQAGEAYYPVLIDAAVLDLMHEYNDIRWLGNDSGHRNTRLYEDIVSGKRPYGGRVRNPEPLPVA